MRLINADAYEFPGDLINEPTINPDDLRPHGWWICPDFDFSDYWKCSACNEEFYFEFDPRETVCNYCPNCGAKMDGKEDE